MADDNNQNQNQQSKQKGGGGGGGNVSGVQWGGKLDPAQMRDENNLGTLITDQLIVAGTAVVATAVMYALTKAVKSAFKIDMAPKSGGNPGGGGGGVNHPGQIFDIVKNQQNNPQFTPKMKQSLIGILQQGLEQAPAPAEQKPEAKDDKSE